MLNLSTVRFNSTCADVYADVISGSVTVLFNNSNKVYRYFNVSRRAILNLCNNPNMSVGFWVNANLIKPARVECFS